MVNDTDSNHQWHLYGQRAGLSYVLSGKPCACAKGDWNQAHAQVDHLRDLDSAWVHAYLHRKEGDLWNADYWYARAKKTRPSCSLQEEWENLVLHFYS